MAATFPVDYRAFLRDLIAPAMRQLGFKGSRGVFELPDERYWALVGFQADWKFGRMGMAHFTVNLTLISKAEYEAERAGWTLTMPARPAANTFGAPPGEQIRIGALVPVSDSDHDRWWLLDGHVRPDNVADEVMAAIRDHAVPWLRSGMI